MRCSIPALFALSLLSVSLSGCNSSSTTSTQTQENYFAKAIKSADKGNYTEALQFYKESTADGVEEAEWEIAKIYRDHIKDELKYFEWLESAANKGVLNAEIEIGTLYIDGSGSVAADHAKAKEWLEKASEHDGGGRAAYALSQITSDNSVYLALLEKSSSLGNVDSTRALADMYQNGSRGVARDTAKSNQYKELASQYSEGQ